MTYQEAVGWMKRGEKIRRSHWKSMFIFCKDNKILMTQGCRAPWYYTFKNMDIFANDWVIATNASPFDEDE